MILTTTIFNKQQFTSTYAANENCVIKLKWIFAACKLYNTRTITIYFFIPKWLRKTKTNIEVLNTESKARTVEIKFYIVVVNNDPTNI